MSIYRPGGFQERRTIFSEWGGGSIPRGPVDGKPGGGGEGFVISVRDELGIWPIGRTIISDGEQQQLRDPQRPYKALFAPEKGRLRQNIALQWDVYLDI